MGGGIITRLLKKLTPLLLLVFVAVAIIPGTVVAQEDSSALTMQQALDMAYKHNPDLRKAQLELDKAEINRDDAAKAVSGIPTGGLVIPEVQQGYNQFQQAEIGLKVAKQTVATEKDRLSKDIINAYTTALKNYNTMETTRLTLEDLKQQLSVSNIAMQTGMMSDYDLSAVQNGIRQAEKGYQAAQAQYDASLAALAALLGQGSNWKPELNSKAVLTKYQREDLAIELSRGLEQSTAVWQAQAQVDIEKSKETWIMPNISSDMQSINTGTAETTLEQAKIATQSAIEQLYYGIDATEGQIAAAEAANVQAQRDLEIAQLKYDVGLATKYSLPGASGSSSLAAATLAAQKAQYNLDSLQAGLAGMKAQFAYLTGQTVYDAEDWTPEPQAVAANQ